MIYHLGQGNMLFARRVLFAMGAVAVSLGLLVVLLFEAQAAAVPAAEQGGRTVYVDASRNDGLVAYWEVAP